mgnify:FL=1
MDTGLGGVRIIVILVDHAGLTEHLVDQFQVTDITNKNGVGGRGQAGVVGAIGFGVVLMDSFCLLNHNARFKRALIQ